MYYAITTHLSYLQRVLRSKAWMDRFLINEPVLYVLRVCAAPLEPFIFCSFYKKNHHYVREKLLVGVAIKRMDGVTKPN